MLVFVMWHNAEKKMKWYDDVVVVVAVGGGVVVVCSCGGWCFFAYTWLNDSVFVV